VLARPVGPARDESEKNFRAAGERSRHRHTAAPAKRSERCLMDPSRPSSSSAWKATSCASIVALELRFLAGRDNLVMDIWRATACQNVKIGQQADLGTPGDSR